MRLLLQWERFLQQPQAILVLTKLEESDSFVTVESPVGAVDRDSFVEILNGFFVSLQLSEAECLLLQIGGVLRILQCCLFKVW